MDVYVAAKQRVFENQRAEDFAVLNADDPICVRIARGIRPKTYWFSRRREPDLGAYVRAGRIILRDGEGEHDVMAVE
jgi:UDP-N-acetylmuramoylalanine--D-glutamate ligase